MSSKDSDEIRIMHIKSNNIEIIIGNETDKIIKKLFELLLRRYQEGLEEWKRKSKFVFDSIDLLCCKLHKISLNRGGSYIDYPEWLKNKKVKCFQYALTVASNYQKIKNNPERRSKIKPFID